MAKKKDKTPKIEPDDYPDYDEEDFGHIPIDMMMGGLDDSSFWHEPDFLLADIVQLMVNLAGLEIGVTLFVKGMTITGTMTSEKQYLQDLSDTFRRRVHVKNKKMSKADRKTFEELFDFTRLAESDIAQDLEDDGIDMPSGVPSTRYLHLKNPLLVGTQGVMDFGQGDAPYIRLRLTLIDGWMLGEVVTPDMFKPDDSGEILH